MKQKIIQQGAEAIISLKNNKITKHRISKSYRHPTLDKKLRKSRTKSESKIIFKLANTLPVPKILNTDEKNYKILMQYINGKKLSENLESLNHQEIAKQIGKNLTLLHNQNIVHGDLTTSNMIFTPKTNHLYFIDFGLGFHSHKIEDKAVDLHLIKQALEAKHHTISKPTFNTILKNYKPEQSKLIIERISVIERRRRYKGKS